MGKVALVVTLLGFVGLVVGLIGTIAFSASDEFVKATLYCNSTNKDPNCNTANTVIDDDGNVCQVGNLGLFVSSYTPGCAVGTTYELNAALEPITDAPTTEFGILFPAQTNFAGLGEQLGFPAEFTTCAAYFEDASIETGIAGIVAGQNASLDTLRLGIKQGFDAGIDEILVNLSTAVKSVGALSELGLLAAAETVGVSLSTTDITALAFPGGVNWATFITGVIANPMTSAAQAKQLTGIRDVVLGVNSFTSCISTAVCLDQAVWLGTPDWDGEVADASGVGIGPLGFYSDYDAIFCSQDCTYEEYLNNTILPAAQVADPAQAATLQLVLDQIQIYFEQVSALVIADPTNPFTSLTKAELNVFLRAFKDNSTGTSPTELAGAALSPFFSTAAFVANTKNSLLLENTIPKALNTPAAAETAAFGILCPTLGLAPTCNFVDVINKAVADDEGLDANVTAGLLGAQQLVTSCVEDGVNDFDECLQNVVASSVITGLYDGPDELSSLETYLANATEQCLDDELDIAAITQAQQLIPVGAGLNGAGLAIAVLALVLYALGKNIKVAKVVILVGAVISLIGLALAVVALLGVIGAPIYASVGGDGDGLEDGDQVFSNSVGYQYILAGAAGNAIGGILLLAGGLCLPTEESDVLTAK